MAIGAITTGMSSKGNGEYLDIQPSAGVEWVIHNLGWGGAAELYKYDGSNLVKMWEDSEAGSIMGIFLHCTNSIYYRLKNVSGGAATLTYDGVVTDE